MVVTCSCCGRGVPDTPEENVSYGEVPYPHDNGFGLCIPCGGDKSSDDFKTVVGFTGQVFFEARFKILRKRLNEKNQKKFDALSYEKKCSIIMDAVIEGKMI